MSDTSAYIVQRLAIEDVIVRMFVATDDRDWPTLEACFTDPFTLDMTSMTGGAPAATRPRDVAQAWAAGFETLDHVHHQIGNLRTEIEGRRARVRCYGVAFHHRAAVAQGVGTRIFVGTYEFGLTAESGRWLIDALTFRLKFIEGNRDLEHAALAQ